VARNLRALGATTRLFGAVGRDARGRELLELLEREGIDASGVASVPGWSTPTKTRVLAAEPRRSLQQVLRLDRDPAGAPPAEARERVRAAVQGLAGEVDALIASDYEYGLLDAPLAREAGRLAAGGVVVVLDPRARLEGCEGLTALTPNVSELARFTARAPEALSAPAELGAAATELLERARPRWLLVTRGNSGMALFGEGLGPLGAAVEASGTGNVTDVTGAGDTAAAVFALALARGLAATEAMHLANAASGVVVQEHGAAVCTPAALRAALAAAPAAAQRAVSAAR
jgi:D-beta-D-heptose 7-phosphate kinase/D-beta-D-heptose 1-phosphate adenosyltransferase